MKSEKNNSYPRENHWALHSVIPRAVNLLKTQNKSWVSLLQWFLTIMSANPSTVGHTLHSWSGFALCVTASALLSNALAKWEEMTPLVSGTCSQYFLQSDSNPFLVITPHWRMNYNYLFTYLYCPRLSSQRPHLHHTILCQLLVAAVTKISLCEKEFILTYGSRKGVHLAREAQQLEARAGRWGTTSPAHHDFMAGEQMHTHQWRKCYHHITSLLD